MKLSIIGCGTMGQCILDGLLEEKKVPVNGFSIEMIWCTVSRKESLSKLVTRYSNHSSDTDGINLKFGLDNQEALQSSDVVIVA